MSSCRGQISGTTRILPVFQMFEFNSLMTPLASSLLCPHAHSPSHDHLHHFLLPPLHNPKPHPNATLPTGPCRLLMNVTRVSPGWPSWSRSSSPSASPSPSWWWAQPWSTPVGAHPVRANTHTYTRIRYFNIFPKVVKSVFISSTVLKNRKSHISSLSPSEAMAKTRLFFLCFFVIFLVLRLPKTSFWPLLSYPKSLLTL